MPLQCKTRTINSILALTLTLTCVAQVQAIMSCTEFGGSFRGFFCSNYFSDTKLVFLDAQYADIGQYESNRVIEFAATFLGFVSNKCKIAVAQLLCGICFPDCEESADGKTTFPKPVCRISCQNFVATCMEDFLKPGGEIDTAKA